MKTDEYISDVITNSQTIDQTSRCVEYRLKLVCQVGRQPNQNTISVVQSAMHQSNYQRLECGCRY